MAVLCFVEVYFHSVTPLRQVGNYAGDGVAPLRHLHSFPRDGVEYNSLHKYTFSQHT